MMDHMLLVVIIWFSSSSNSSLVYKSLPAIKIDDSVLLPDTAHPLGHINAISGLSP